MNRPARWCAALAVAAHAYVTRFIEEAKRDGTVHRALDGAGFSHLPVAP